MKDDERWVDADTKLPPIRKWVLVSGIYLDSRENRWETITFAQYDGTGWRDKEYHDISVQAWMELPKYYSKTKKICEW